MSVLGRSDDLVASKFALFDELCVNVLKKSETSNSHYFIHPQDIEGTESGAGLRMINRIWSNCKFMDYLAGTT